METCGGRGRCRVGVGVGGLGGLWGLSRGCLMMRFLSPHTSSTRFVVGQNLYDRSLPPPHTHPSHTTADRPGAPPLEAVAGVPTPRQCTHPPLLDGGGSARSAKSRAEQWRGGGDRRQGSAASGGACDRPRRELPPLTVPPRRFAKGGCGQSGRKEARDDVGRRRGAPGHGVDGAVAGVGVAPRRRRHLLHRVRRVLEQIVRLVRLPA